MAVSATLTLPGQPASGNSIFEPLGGDGTRAPLGCYQSSVAVAGDAGGGNATLTINFDPRYTNLCAWINLTVASAAAAPDFQCRLHGGTGTITPDVHVVGTMPHQAVETPNAAFLWFPPPLYFIQLGQIRMSVLNVDVTETYTLITQIYCFHPEVTRITPLPLLQLNVPGVSAPAAV